jgi:hypothetical protein
VRAFVAAAAASPILASGLAALDAGGTHPQGAPAPRGCPLRWTLASMLALHLRSARPGADEPALLAALWTLESWWDAWRSPATTVLGDYVRHMAAFDHARAVRMSASWRAEFVELRAAVVGAQRALLAGVRWRLTLDPAGDVLPCYAALFGAAAAAVAATLQAQPAGAAATPATAATAPPPRSEPAWVASMEALAGRVLAKSALVRAAAVATQLADEAQGEAQSGAKRRRVC